MTTLFIPITYKTIESFVAPRARKGCNETAYRTASAMCSDASRRAPNKIRALLKAYTQTKEKTLSEIIDFHYRFEAIHPFQDGNGRVGRLILFKECLRNNIVPFIIDDDMKMFYYRGLQNWVNEKGFLTDTCLAAQDEFKKHLDYFRIKY